MKRFSSLIVLITFFFSSFSSYPAFANLPQPGTMLLPSGEASLPVLKGLRLDPNDPLHMQFIIDPGTNKTVDKDQANQLIRYFLAALAMPQQDIWVNLSPYEKERIMEDNLSYTDLGKAMLEQDYLLKQLASSLTYPETKMGKKYWEAINSVGANNHSPANNSFNKVWISARESEVYEGTNTVVITKASLKALTDRDYLAMQNNGRFDTSRSLSAKRIETNGTLSDHSADAFKQTILPQIETELNTGKNFANLRQIYNAVILASWFKNKFKESFFKYYLNQKNINGIALDDKTSKEKIFNLYVQAFQKGAYNYIKKERVAANGDGSLARMADGKRTVPISGMKITRRAYFSGGIPPNMGLPPTGPSIAPNSAAVAQGERLPVADVRPGNSSSLVLKSLLREIGFKPATIEQRAWIAQTAVDLGQEAGLAEEDLSLLGEVCLLMDLGRLTEDIAAADYVATVNLFQEQSISTSADTLIDNALKGKYLKSDGTPDMLAYAKSVIGDKWQPFMENTIPALVSHQQLTISMLQERQYPVSADMRALILAHHDFRTLRLTGEESRSPERIRLILAVIRLSLISSYGNAEFTSSLAGQDEFMRERIAKEKMGESGEAALIPYRKLLADHNGVLWARIREIRQKGNKPVSRKGDEKFAPVVNLRFSAESSAKEAEVAYLVQQLKISFIARLAAMPADDKLYLAALAILNARVGLDDKTLIGEVDISEALGLPEKSVMVPINLGMGGAPVYAASKGVPQSPALLEQISFGQRFQRANYSSIKLSGLKRSFARDPWAVAGAIAAAFKTGVESVWVSGSGRETTYRSKAGGDPGIVAIRFDNHVSVNIRFYEDKMFIDFPIGQRQYTDRLYAIVKALANVEPDTTTKINPIASLNPIEQEVTQNAEKLRNILRNNCDGFVAALNDVAPGANIALLLNSTLGIAKEDQFTTRGKQYELEVSLRIPGGSQASLRFTRTFDGQKIVDIDWSGDPAGQKRISRALHYALSVLDEQGQPKKPAIFGTPAALRQGDEVTQALRKLEEYGFHHDTSRKTLEDSLRVAMESLERNKGVTNSHNVQDYDYRAVEILLKVARIMDDYRGAFNGWDGFEAQFRKILSGLQRFKYNGPENQALTGVNDTIDLLVRWAHSGVAGGAIRDAIYMYRPIEANERVYLISQCDQYNLPRALAEQAYYDTKEALSAAGIITEPSQIVELAARMIKAVGFKSQNPDTYGLKIPGLNHDRSWQELLVEELGARAQQIENAPKLPVELALYERQAAYDTNAAIRKLDSKANIPLIERVRAGELLDVIFRSLPTLVANDKEGNRKGVDLLLTTKAIDQLADFPYFASANDNRLIESLEHRSAMFKEMLAALDRDSISLGSARRKRWAESGLDQDPAFMKMFEQPDARMPEWIRQYQQLADYIDQAVAKIKTAQALWDLIDSQLGKMCPGSNAITGKERSTLIWWIMVNQKAGEGFAPHLQMAMAYPKVLLDQDIPAVANLDIKGLLMAGRSGGEAAAQSVEQLKQALAGKLALFTEKLKYDPWLFLHAISQEYGHKVKTIECWMGGSRITSLAQLRLFLFGRLKTKAASYIPVMRNSPLILESLAITFEDGSVFRISEGDGKKVSAQGQNQEQLLQVVSKALNAERGEIIPLQFDLMQTPQERAITARVEVLRDLLENHTKSLLDRLNKRFGTTSFRLEIGSGEVYGRAFSDDPTLAHSLYDYHKRSDRWRLTLIVPDDKGERQGVDIWVNRMDAAFPNPTLMVEVVNSEYGQGMNERTTEIAQAVADVLEEMAGNNGSPATGGTLTPAQGQPPTGGIAWASVAASTQGQGKFYFTRIPTTTEIKKVFDNVSFTVVALKENQSLREFAGLK